MNYCDTRLYKIWGDMKNRCNNPNNTVFKFYGARNIGVCKEWEQFEPFRDWATNNGYTDELTIDRIDVNGNYEPSNCRWVTMKEQSRNKRNNHFVTYNNETHCLSEWAERYNINYKMLFKRLKSGWSFEKAITTKKLNPSECAITNKNFKKVYCKEIDTIFNSAEEASKYCLKFLNKKVKGISRSCKSSYLKAGGIKWYYFQEQNND